MTVLNGPGRAEARRCTSCGEAFTGEHWQRLCWGCWRGKRDLGERVEQINRGYWEGWNAGYRRGVQDADEESLAMDAGLLRDLIGLCHPDHHPPERRAAANATTAQLLQMRARVAA